MMINTDWCRTMAAYNAGMNRRIYDAAGRLDDAARRQDQGAFFGSIFATLNHILWADHMWMHRFDGWARPVAGLAESVAFEPDWRALVAARICTDDGIADWAARVTQEQLERDLAWFSAATQAEMRRPCWLLVTHMFNHQTHHRGQAHALLTRLGQQTAETDLPWVVDLPGLGL